MRRTWSARRLAGAGWSMGALGGIAVLGLLLTGASVDGRTDGRDGPLVARIVRPIASHDQTSQSLVMRGRDPGTGRLASLRDPDECFDCHDDDTMTMERDGREISLYVSPDEYAAAPHSSVDCVECHVGYDPDEEPHTETPHSVECQNCHSGESSALHAGGHRSDLSCASCHDDLHTRIGTGSGEADCQSCHEEAARDVRASVHAEEEAGPGCLDCHQPHGVARANSETCLSCHGKREFVHRHILHEDIEAVLRYTESIHGDDTDCNDCHAGHLVRHVDDPESPVARENVANTCAACHDDVAEQYLGSEHGEALKSGFEEAPTCTDCHGEHDIHQITSSDSPVRRAHEVEVCESCHLDDEHVVARMTHTTGFVASYDLSVHGRAAASGNEEAAICSDCHGAHQALKASNPTSRINKFHLASTCGRCHDEVEASFEGSIHGTALAEGIADAPTCTTCHSEHAIADHTDPNAPVAPVNVSEQVCRPCHESYKLSEKYGFPSDRTTSFGDSYHGLATRFGSGESANCASCHGVHDILPSTDERSRVYPANLEDTCGQCHPGANENFARGSVHVIRTPQGDRLLYWISIIYILLIVVTIGGMGIHNILDWWRKTVEDYRRRLRTSPAAAFATGGKRGLYVRMTLSERIQHALLAGSFVLLVITGFMLRFPDAWWVVLLRDAFGTAVFDTRGVIHRIAAVVMVGDSLYHLYYIIFTTRGQQIIHDIMFRGQDFRDFVQMMRYYAGRTNERPRFGRFNYVEKSEYWALMWGTVVMTLTGVALWFENQTMSHFSKLFLDVAETIHYYEAWLAFLAIVVWHFYYVIFNPDVYPMNFTWLTGKITEEEMEHEHPLELERIKGAGSED